MSFEIHLDVAASLEAMPHQGTLVDGVPAMKGLADLRRYRKVIEATRPDLVIQTGTAVGGSALWFADGGLDVVTIDVDDSRIHPSVLQSARITVLTGSSTDDGVLDTVWKLAAGYVKVMVVLDSDHSCQHVCREIEAYGPLVSSGCYLVVEDGIYDLSPDDGPFKPGPLSAIELRLVGDNQWERDIEIEKSDPVSMYPAGWWRRA